MKNIIYKFSIIVAVLFIGNACTEPEDLITENANSGGALVDVSKSSGKLLGIPDPNTGEMSFDEVELNFNLRLDLGGQRVDSYEVVKSINGEGQTTVAASNILPLEFSLTSAAEFVEGTGMSVSDLRVGDIVTFETYVITNNGQRYKAGPNEGTVAITVNCSSNLAGDYMVTGVRSDGGTYGPYPLTVTESGPGQYVSSRSGSWFQSGAFSGPSGESRMEFSDTCGELSIPEQDLNLGQYSNDQYGTGSFDGVDGRVDGGTGVITYEYVISFGSGDITYTETITPL